MGSWTYSAKPTQGCTTQKKANSGYGKNILETQNRIWKMGKTTQVIQIIQKMLDGLPKAKMTFVHTRIMGLPSQPRNITKNGFATQKKWVKWGKMTQDEQFI